MHLGFESGYCFVTHVRGGGVTSLGRPTHQSTSENFSSGKTSNLLKRHEI